MATTINNLELYEFLREEVECGISYNINTKDIEAIGWVRFCDLDKFIELIDMDLYSEGGLDCKLQRDGIAIDLNEIIEYQGDNVLDYKNIFNDQREFENVKNLLKKYGRK